MKNLLLIFILVSSSHQGIATAYYFSNKGDDSNDGKSVTTAWSTLKKLAEAQHFFKSGDSLLFENGSIFIGQLNISTSGLYLGAYGFGPKPIISGSIEI